MSGPPISGSVAARNTNSIRRPFDWEIGQVEEGLTDEFEGGSDRRVKRAVGEEVEAGKFPWSRRRETGESGHRISSELPTEYEEVVDCVYPVELEVEGISREEETYISQQLSLFAETGDEAALARFGGAVFKVAGGERSVVRQVFNSMKGYVLLRTKWKIGFPTTTNWISSSQ
ncbi:hypothetical protein ACLI4Z_11705 [Natrialbaceae archaeon A-arb3/5]